MLSQHSENVNVTRDVFRLPMVSISRCWLRRQAGGFDGHLFHTVRTLPDQFASCLAACSGDRAIQTSLADHSACTRSCLIGNSRDSETIGVVSGHNLY